MERIESLLSDEHFASFYLILSFNSFEVVPITVVSLQMGKQRPRVVKAFAQGQDIGRTGSKAGLF